MTSDTRLCSYRGTQKPTQVLRVLYSGCPLPDPAQSTPYLNGVHRRRGSPAPAASLLEEEKSRLRPSQAQLCAGGGNPNAPPLQKFLKKPHMACSWGPATGFRRIRCFSLSVWRPMFHQRRKPDLNPTSMERGGDFLLRCGISDHVSV